MLGDVLFAASKSASWAHYTNALRWNLVIESTRLYAWGILFAFAAGTFLNVGSGYSSQKLPVTGAQNMSLPGIARDEGRPQAIGRREKSGGHICVPAVSSWLADLGRCDLEHPCLNLHAWVSWLSWPSLTNVLAEGWELCAQEKEDKEEDVPESSQDCPVNDLPESTPYPFWSPPVPCRTTSRQVSRRKRRRSELGGWLQAILDMTGILLRAPEHSRALGLLAV